MKDNSVEASETRFKALLAACSDTVYSMSADWRVMKELDGRGLLRDTHEPTTDWLDQYIPSDDMLQVKSVIEEAIKEKKLFQLEHRVILADGSVGWVNSRAVPILCGQGEIVEWLGTVSNITEHKRAEEALRKAVEQSEKQRRLYEAITSGTPDLMYVFDLDYRFTYVNNALLSMWGKNWEDAVGKGLIENGYEPWHAQMHQKEIDQVRATKKPIRGEVAFPHAVLGKRTYDYIFTPVFDEHGEVEAVAGTTRDVTEQKMNEIRKNDFIGMVSHELKTPLTSMKGYIQMLLVKLRQRNDELAVSALEKTNTQIAKMTRMINDFLNVSRLESGKIHINLQQFDLALLINEVAEEIHATIGSHEIIFAPVDTTYVNADRDKTGQVIHNLISNAVKYSPAGSTVNVACNYADGRVIFSVKDQGMGIKPDDLPKIFDRFFRVEDLHMFSISGFGIGLYLCSEILERQSGHIWAESEFGKGSTFSFSLPSSGNSSHQV